MTQVSYDFPNVEKKIFPPCHIVRASPIAATAFLSFSFISSLCANHGRSYKKEKLFSLLSGFFLFFALPLGGLSSVCLSTRTNDNSQRMLRSIKQKSC